MRAVSAALAVRDPRLSSTARLVQLVLAGNVQRGRVRLLQKDLLALTNLDPRTARKGIASLQELGYLREVQRAGTSPVYELDFPSSTEGVASNVGSVPAGQ